MPKVLYATGASVPTTIVAKRLSINCGAINGDSDTIACDSTARLEVGDSVVFRDPFQQLYFSSTTNADSDTITIPYSLQVNQPITFTGFTRQLSCTGTLQYTYVTCTSVIGLSKYDPITFAINIGGGNKAGAGIIAGRQYYIDFIPVQFNNRFDISASPYLAGTLRVLTDTRPFTATVQPQKFDGIIEKKRYYIKEVVSSQVYRLSTTQGGPTLALNSVTGIISANTSPFNYGGIVPGVKYYIKEIVDSNNFKISATKFGTIMDLTTTVGTIKADITTDFTTDSSGANSQGLLTIFEAVGATPEEKYAPINNPYTNINRIYFDTRFDYLNIVNSFSAFISFPFENVTQECGKKGKNCALVPRSNIRMILLGAHGQNYIPAVIGYDLITTRALCGDQIVQVNGPSSFRLFQLLVDENNIWLKERWYVRVEPLQEKSFIFKVFVFNKPVPV